MLEPTAALQKALMDSDKDVRTAARLALSRLDRARKARDSMAILSGDDKPAKLQLISALVDSGGDQAMETLGRMLAEDEDEDCRAAAARGLGALGLEEAEPALVTAASDASLSVRVEVARALGAIGHTEAASALVRLLNGEPSVAAEAAEALARLRAADAVPDIAKCLASPSAELRAAAAKSLGHLRDPRALNELAAAIDDADRDVRLAAVQALAEMPVP